MKKNYYILVLLSGLIACDNSIPTPKETVTNYYNARNEVNFDKIKMYVSDSITFTEGDYVMPYDEDSFYEVFKWDSIFKPTYTLEQLEEKNDQIIATVTLSSIRNRFLKNDAMTCKSLLSFENGKISKVEALDCANANWKLWEQERDSLVNWIHKKHPELDGFIYDMTMKGAQNYIKAIEFYQNRKDTLL